MPTTNERKEAKPNGEPKSDYQYATESASKTGGDGELKNNQREETAPQSEQEKAVAENAQVQFLRNQRENLPSTLKILNERLTTRDENPKTKGAGLIVDREVTPREDLDIVQETPLDLASDVQYNPQYQNFTEAMFSNPMGDIMAGGASIIRKRKEALDKKAKQQKFEERYLRGEEGLNENLDELKSQFAGYSGLFESFVPNKEMFRNPEDGTIDFKAYYEALGKNMDRLEKRIGSDRDLKKAIEVKYALQQLPEITSFLEDVSKQHKDGIVNRDKALALIAQSYDPELYAILMQDDKAKEAFYEITKNYPLFKDFLDNQTERYKAMMGAGSKEDALLPRNALALTTANQQIAQLEKEKSEIFEKIKTTAHEQRIIEKGENAKDMTDKEWKKKYPHLQKTRQDAINESDNVKRAINKRGLDIKPQIDNINNSIRKQQEAVAVVQSALETSHKNYTDKGLGEITDYRLVQYPEVKDIGKTDPAKIQNVVDSTKAEVLKPEDEEYENKVDSWLFP